MSSLPPYHPAEADLTVRLVLASDLPEGLDGAGTGVPPLAAATVDAAELLTRRGVVEIAGQEDELASLLRRLIGARGALPPVRFYPGGGAELRVLRGHVTLRALNRGAPWG